MRVLVTGGTGVVGESAVTALLQRGHSVRLLSRHAARDARQWPHGVTPWPGDVANEASIRGAADECDAVVHLVGIVEEHPPEATFDRVNVEGTRHIVREAERAGVGRLVYVSSLGAERGRSPYQRSKFAGEEIVRAFSGHVILRSGAVYGPGDEHLSVLLRMVRTLPVVPMVGGGDQPFQPLWHEDFAEVIATAVERDDLAGRTLDVAGDEVTTQRDLMDRLRTLVDREPVRVPIPEFLASLGVKAAETLGIDVPVAESQVTMLLEGNVIPPGSINAITEVCGVRPTPLDEGLAKLADAGPEQLPSKGIGPLKRKRFWIDIRGSRYDANGLAAIVRTQFAELMPRIVDTAAEPAAPDRIEEGETLTLGMPLRGHVQMRVADVTDRQFTLLTTEGHPLAGAVRFLVEERGDAVRFEIQLYERAANAIDYVLMRTLGEPLRDANWRQMARNVVEASGGEGGEIEHAAEELDEQQAERIEEWARELMMERKRDEAGV